MKKEIRSEFDLIQAISGQDEHGAGKCSITIQPQRCDAEGNLVNTDTEFETDKPIVQMFKQVGGFVLVDFVFESVHDIELQQMFGYFRDFFAATNSINEDDQDFPVLVVSIMPNTYSGEYWTMGINPIFYTLAPDDTMGEPKILRVLFASDEDIDEIPNFLFMKSDEDELKQMREEDDLEDEFDDDESDNSEELD